MGSCLLRLVDFEFLFGVINVGEDTLELLHSSMQENRRMG